MKRISMICAAALIASSCGPSSTTRPTDKVETVAEPATPAPAPLTQEERSKRCGDRLMHYRELGVWVHGGVRPGVDPDAWELLKDEERDEMFEIAACMATAGLPGERIVTISEAGNGPEIETRRVTVK